MKTYNNFNEMFNANISNVHHSIFNREVDDTQLAKLKEVVSNLIKGMEILLNQKDFFEHIGNSIEYLKQQVEDLKNVYSNAIGK